MANRYASRQEYSDAPPAYSDIIADPSAVEIKTDGPPSYESLNINPSAPSRYDPLRHQPENNQSPRRQNEPIYHYHTSTAPSGGRQGRHEYINPEYEYSIPSTQSANPPVVSGTYTWGSQSSTCDCNANKTCLLVTGSIVIVGILIVCVTVPVVLRSRDSTVKDWEKMKKYPNHTQMRILKSGVFTVPADVYEMDVIAVGGGGGGDQRGRFYGGLGWSSSFSWHVFAGGGHGGDGFKGGKGGSGDTANGGRGSDGGRCDSGGGAAGETKRGDKSGSPGSSTHPFCGAGGSYSCRGNKLHMRRGSSGPGGSAPVLDAAGLYGGGGASDGSGGAGGGGGYSRKVVRVTPGRRMDVTVGRAGSPSFGRPGPGIVVVSWWGPIDPTGEWMDSTDDIFKADADTPATTKRLRTTTTKAPSTTTTRQHYSANWTWYSIAESSDHRQYKYTSSDNFVVPRGVDVVDVVVIGGGGGGRDGHAKFLGTNGRGGPGGTSRFGYVFATGGRGANYDSTGGEGGWGSTAHGGQGGRGGGCSAGAGAAGETSPGDGREKPGSSTNPFCGGGASSAGECSKNIPPATSGPGGSPPKRRNGGNYGGGGGSRAGGRAGGGGGYSRAVVRVRPGQRIPVVVGRAGAGYWAGRAAPGVVVVSIHGPVDPFKTISSPSNFIKDSATVCSTRGGHCQTTLQCPSGHERVSWSCGISGVTCCAILS